jgi:hypothetical protein
MPQQGFRDINGVRVDFADIDPVKDAQRFNCSPATLSMLIDAVRARDGVGYSASMLGGTPRQHLLKAGDYYPTTGQCIASHMGTLKHQQINVDRPGLIVEQRFTSKRDPRLSGQIDHAAVVEMTDDGTLVVDLYDLKTVKWYSVTLIAKDIWKNHPDYAWQLNLCAAMMEESGIQCWLCEGVGSVDDISSNPARCFLCSGLSSIPVRVRNLYLECIPADSSYKQQDEAAKLGFSEFQKVLIPIERKSADETYRVYAEAMELRNKAVADGYAPLCSDRWSNRNVDNLRCRYYCDVRDECIAFSHAHGEAHPIAPLHVALEASIAAASAEVR